MGLPSIDITFKTAAQVTIAMGDKGYVGLIVRDTKQAGAHYLTRASKIPAELTADNKAYIERAFAGYVNPPKGVYVYVTDEEDVNLAEALAYFATQKWIICAARLISRRRRRRRLKAGLRSEGKRTAISRLYCPNWSRTTIR